MNWISVKDKMPKSGKKVLAAYKNEQDHWRIITAWHFDRWTHEIESYDEEGLDEYSEEMDTYFYQEGWYEVINNWEDYGFCSVYEGEVSHWMELPEPPKEETS